MAFILATKAGNDAGVPAGQDVGEVVGRVDEQAVEQLALGQHLARLHRDVGLAPTASSASASATSAGVMVTPGPLGAGGQGVVAAGSR